MKKSFSVIEIILAVFIFTIFSTAALIGILGGLNLSHKGGEFTIASQYAIEGIEAVRSIKNRGFSNLVNTSSTGLAKVSGVWQFSGTNNVFDKYTRYITIADVYRDSFGNIVDSGGTLDPLSKKIVSTVSWTVGPSLNQTISYITYLTDWKRPFEKGGILVFGNGGTTSDAMVYRLFDGSSWGAFLSTADVDPSTTNKAARAIRVFASKTRNEKILVSRHYNGTNQFIYAQVFNGTSWGNVILLSSWSSTSYLNVLNFDGTYLQNGDFMVVYSDNTTTPKFRIWNGSSWSAAISMVALFGVPLHIEIENRPSSNEVMAAFLDTALDTNTEYFNGGAYLSSNWTKVNHGLNAPAANRKIVDFKWASNGVTGALVFTNSTTDKTIRGRIFVANGSGSGRWGRVALSSPQTNNVGGLLMTPRPSANEFLVCDKNTATSPSIVCRRLIFRGTIPFWSAPTNNVIGRTDAGIQLSFDLIYNKASGKALIVYSDNTAIPKYKIYDPQTNTITPTATAISTSPYTLSSPVRTVKLTLSPISSTIMAFFSDNARRNYSSLYTGSFSSFTQHGTNGSAVNDYWYDFIWDQN